MRLLWLVAICMSAIFSGAATRALAGEGDAASWCYELRVLAGEAFADSPVPGVVFDANVTAIAYRSDATNTFNVLYGLAAPAGTEVVVHLRAGAGEQVGLVSRAPSPPGEFQVNWVMGWDGHVEWRGDDAFGRVVPGERCANSAESIDDGRLNRADPAALAAVFRTSSGYEVWTIDPETAAGQSAFSVTDTQIDRARAEAAAAQQNQVLASAEGGAVTFSVLTTGSCQLNYTSLDGQLRPFIFVCTAANN